jgi:trans-2-enoyl-CoA reductase
MVVLYERRGRKKFLAVAAASHYGEAVRRISTAFGRNYQLDVYESRSRVKFCL